MGLRLWPIPLEKGSKPTAHGERQTNNECENGTERKPLPSSGGLSLSQLESHLWESANILRGPVDAADFKSYVFLTCPP